MRKPAAGCRRRGNVSDWYEHMQWEPFWHEAGSARNWDRASHPFSVAYRSESRIWGVSRCLGHWERKREVKVGGGLQVYLHPIVEE
jgi:hypothetical protein